MSLCWAASGWAQGTASQPRTLSAGVCGTTNWVCVADCIDGACVEQCLRQGCEEALGRLQACTVKSGCAPDDTTCSARVCGATCQRAFEPAPRSPEKEKPHPCEGFTAGGSGWVPEKVVGRWVLSAATLKPEFKSELERLNPSPRPDFQRALEVTPSGCFLMSTMLEDATLGQGNFLEIRAWGTFTVTDDNKVVLQTKDGQAVGMVCGKPRIFGLSKGQFQGPRYTFSVEKNTLTLVADDPSKRTFQFQRASAAAPQEPTEK